MDITNTYVADLVVGRLAWAHVAGEDRLHLDRIVERVQPYVSTTGDYTRATVQHALDELAAAGLVDTASAYGDVTYGIVVPDGEPERETPAWRDQARRAAERILGEMDAEPGNLTDVDEQLFDVVRTLDLLDRTDR